MILRGHTRKTYSLVSSISRNISGSKSKLCCQSFAEAVEHRLSLSLITSLKSIRISTDVVTFHTIIKKTGRIRQGGGAKTSECGFPARIFPTIWAVF